ncbi:hypothetical protein PINS_up023660 [Pythium insidiosum]|nr:hypothetical protein PINS_up014968 [Pythium insidiosum]GLE11294.1 hypothetical protein PINS_up023660 [Pythium insidiosum]
MSSREFSKKMAQEKVITRSRSASDRGTQAPSVALEPLHKAEANAASPVVEDKYGRSPLHEAVRRGDLMAVQKLVAAQPELLRQPDKRGNHPLHYAASSTAKFAREIVFALLQAGAFANAVNGRGQTPLLIQVITNDSDSDVIARLLLLHNAKPHIKVTNDMLLPQFAKSRGLHKVAEALCEFM